MRRRSISCAFVSRFRAETRGAVARFGSGAPARWGTQRKALSKLWPPPKNVRRGIRGAGGAVFGADRGVDGGARAARGHAFYGGCGAIADICRTDRGERPDRVPRTQRPRPSRARSAATGMAALLGALDAQGARRPTPTAGPTAALSLRTPPAPRSTPDVWSESHTGPKSAGLSERRRLCRAPERQSAGDTPAAPSRSGREPPRRCRQIRPWVRTGGRRTPIPKEIVHRPAVGAALLHHTDGRSLQDRSMRCGCLALRDAAAIPESGNAARSRFAPPPPRKAARADATGAVATAPLVEARACRSRFTLGGALIGSSPVRKDGLARSRCRVAVRSRRPKCATIAATGPDCRKNAPLVPFCGREGPAYRFL